MSAISIYRPEFWGSVHDGYRNHLKIHRNVASWTMTMDSSNTNQAMKKEDVSIQISTPPPPLQSSTPNRLQFNREALADPDLVHTRRLEFGQFVAREAVLDEELWTAAWLRAESHWENRTNERYVDSFKRKFADQEFNAIKRRCSSGQHGQNCTTCIVTVRKEQKHIKRTVIKSVVATLDMSLRHLMHGENFPGVEPEFMLLERENSHVCTINRGIRNKYAYIANLCVVKAARRQGIASNMLKFAVETARSSGIEQVYVHVHRNNAPAQALYQKIGFEVVEIASSQLLEEQTYLLCINTQNLNNVH